MKVINNPEREAWSTLAQRPVSSIPNIRKIVEEILTKVKNDGDAAVLEYTARFDMCIQAALWVSVESRKAAAEYISPALKDAINLAVNNITRFYKEELRPNSEAVEVAPGVRCWRKSVPIDTIGLYIPAGTAPLFSTLYMLAIPAMLAGCKDIILCSPPNRNGEISAEILYVADLLHIENIFKCGGAQAIAAMAYGTETIPRVDKIFGPGNAYVNLAKQIVSSEGVAIDLPAGPSEALIIGDEYADPAWIAADLISQAEHDPDSQVVLVTTDFRLVEKVKAAIVLQLETLPRREIAAQCLSKGLAIFFNDLVEAIKFANLYAPEHLLIQHTKSEEIATQIRNAGSVFVGPYSAEVFGDYLSGTNHVLPTCGYARSYSGVSTSSFLKTVTFQEVSAEGFKVLSAPAQTLAKAEGLEGHKRAVEIRE